MLRVRETERGGKSGLGVVDFALALDLQQFRLAQVHLREVGVEARLELVFREHGNLVEGELTFFCRLGRDVGDGMGAKEIEVGPINLEHDRGARGLQSVGGGIGAEMRSLGEFVGLPEIIEKLAQRRAIGLARIDRRVVETAFGRQARTGAARRPYRTGDRFAGKNCERASAICWRTESAVMRAAAICG